MNVLLSLNGENLHEVQQILGHSSYKLTLDLDNHLVPEAHANRAAGVERQLQTLEAARITREARRQAELDAAAGIDSRSGLLSDPLSAQPQMAVA